MLPIRFKQRSISGKASITLACVIAVALASLGWRFSVGSPRPWPAAEVPVAFWAWRNDAPSNEDVERATREAHASVLFMRAGQIHYESGALRRVREVAGKFPHGIELHLVYNSTRAVLAEFEHLDPLKLADLVNETYAEDAARALRDGATVVGLQLDLDAPTRLLPHYARILSALRERLPKGLKLSVTGLPTWMGSKALVDILDVVDFWIPQCYGATIPERLDQVAAISSPQAVARAVARARELNRPFYAGLSAYGYAILYDTRGVLIALRGDIDPTRIADDANFELIERRPFDVRTQADGDSHAPDAGEWRYVYRARSDEVVDGLVIRAGESLMLDVPGTETLRKSARAVRAEAGERLLGICVFRLPGDADTSTLRVEQVAAALADDAPTASTEVRAEKHLQTNSASAQEQIRSLKLTATSRGTMSALMGDDAFRIDVRIPTGSLHTVRLAGFASAETLCASTNTMSAGDEAVAQPCAERRANILRLKANTWMTGASASVFISFNEDPPPTLALQLRMQTEDGRVWQQQQQVTIDNGAER